MYLIMKALHVAAVMSWMAGLLLQSFALKTAVQHGSPDHRHDTGFLQGVYRWDQRVTAPAMGLVWVLGIAMAMQARWFGNGWLTLKLVLVIALSALHGIQAGKLRRALSQSQPVTDPLVGNGGGLILAAGLAIAVLVITKPF